MNCGCGYVSLTAWCGCRGMIWYVWILCMRKCGLKMLLLLTVLVSFCSWAGGGRSGYVSLVDKRLQIISGGSSASDNPARLFVYDVSMVGSTCNGSTPTLFFDSNPLAKELYSMLLTAKATGINVEIIASRCRDLGGVLFPDVDSIYLE